MGKIRTVENSRFTLYKTEIQDWYLADEVDRRIAELEDCVDSQSAQIAELEAERRWKMASDYLTEPEDGE